MDEASAVAFSTSTAWLINGGHIRRTAWGRTTSRRVWSFESPRARAACVCPLWTAWTPPRTISPTYAVLKSPRLRIAVVSADMRTSKSSGRQ